MVRLMPIASAAIPLSRIDTTAPLNFAFSILMTPRTMNMVTMRMRYYLLKSVPSIKFQPSCGIFSVSEGALQASAASENVRVADYVHNGLAEGQRGGGTIGPATMATKPGPRPFCLR